MARPGVFAAVGVLAVALAAVPLVARLRTADDTRPDPTASFVTCRGGDCTGKDPLALHCAPDAWTSAALPADGAYLELRISDGCDAAWARISGSAVGDRVWVETDGVRGRIVTIADAASTQRYVATLMVPLSRPADTRACVMHDNEQMNCTPYGGTSPVPVPTPSIAADR